MEMGKKLYCGANCKIKATATVGGGTELHVICADATRLLTRKDEVPEGFALLMEGSGTRY